MIKYITRYPDGRAGYALLVLRFCCAIAAFGIAGTLAGGRIGIDFLYVAAGLAAVGLAIGLATRVIAVFVGLAVVATLFVSDPQLQLLLAGQIGGCAVLALLGAGAYSVDAQRYGRRVFELQSSAPDRGDSD